MKQSTIKHVLVSAILVALTGGCGGGPRSYDDCILQYVKAGMTSDAVGAVRGSCHAKFPEQRLLSDAELQLLDGRAGLS